MRVVAVFPSFFSNGDGVSIAWITWRNVTYGDFVVTRIRSGYAQEY